VKAGVTGSQPRPYQVTIALQTLALDDGDKLIDALSQQAIFASKLLAARGAGYRGGFYDWGCRSSHAPEGSRNRWLVSRLVEPCKHVAAVYYLLGEEFDRDPFLLFICAA